MHKNKRAILLPYLHSQQRISDLHLLGGIHTPHENGLGLLIGACSSGGMQEWVLDMGGSHFVLAMVANTHT